VNSGVDSNGRTIFVAGAHRDDGKRFVVHADEKPTAFLELEAVIFVGQFINSNSSPYDPAVSCVDW